MRNTPSSLWFAGMALDSTRHSYAARFLERPGLLTRL